MITNFLILIAVATIARPIMRILFAIYYHCQALNLKSLYGQGWAVITGATDGIGFGFCQ